MAKLNFQHHNQSLVSHDPLEIIIIWFDAQIWSITGPQVFAAFFVEFIFQDSLINRKLKTKAFIWNWKL